MSVEDIITKINSSEFSEFASKMKQKREENRLKRDNLAVGQIYEGRVTNITNFGAFVSLGFIDGLVHLKELSWKYIKSPEEIVSLNDIIRVQVISIENGKIALSRKALMPKIESLQEGDELLCSIVKKLDYAYIVDIGDYTALALTQNMSSKNYLVGEQVKCNVVSNMIDEKKHHKILVGNISSITEFVNSHVVGEHVLAEYITNIVGEKPNIVVSINGLKIDVPHSKVIDPYLSKITNGDIEPGRTLEFV